ncbi:MAG: acetyl-CoA carboxylase carboxyltransferase subunit alpha [Gammaproteobacteria bacterium]
MAEKTNTGNGKPPEAKDVILNFLDFEQPIAELDAKIQELRYVGADTDINISDEINRLQKHSKDLTSSIFASLTAWQVAQVARHPLRPYTLDYIQRIFTDFEELHGDRSYADDPAIVAGLARFNGNPVAIVGHQKGRDTRDRIYRNYGMPRPEGYRKALRVMQLAERFRLPVFSFIDTPGAYPGIGAEERGQSEAISRNLLAMSGLKTPIIATVIGEGGSGGALAIGVADRLLMLEYSTYSVISPEGCASILWKSANKAEEAAEVMGITAKRLSELGLVDHIVNEPLGGVHRDYDAAAAYLKQSLARVYAELTMLEKDVLVAERLKRFRTYGFYTV